ncbi:MAG: recombinase family protein [Gammaproteobacteria bacterium]
MELRINESEAAVVRRVFELCARGAGLKGIAKELNAGRALAPRSQQGRVRARAPSSVRELLRRELYGGRRVWNKTRKRDVWGQRRQHAKAPSEWLTVDAEHLRIVPEALWTAAHQRIKTRASAYERWRRGAPGGAPDGRGVRKKYFLAGFGRCGVCGGSMRTVSRSSTAGRSFRYVCSTYWNRGASVCPNGRMVAMSVADRAVQELLAAEVLRPTRIEGALDYAVDLLLRDPSQVDRRVWLEQRLAAIEVELANLADTAARGGGVPVILDALSLREGERRRVRGELAETASRSRVAPMDPEQLRTRLRGYLGDWAGLVTENVAEARGLLEVVLADRIVFVPLERIGDAPNRHQLTVPIAFDRIMTAAIPEMAVGLQDKLASPPGFEPGFQP